MQQAIAHTADEVYGALDDADKERVRNIFVRLTHFDEETAQGEEGRDTQRRVGAKELVLA